MCTTIGFSYKEGIVFGRTLEFGIDMDNHIVYVPGNTEDFIQTPDENYASKYATIGTGFFKMATYGDGINEKGLMGSSNLLPGGYASFAGQPVQGKRNMTIFSAFNYLLTRCSDIKEVRQEAETLAILQNSEAGDYAALGMHFFFMDTSGKGIVLEPKDGELLAYDNPYGVLTNAPEFPWHVTNLKNYVNLQPVNAEAKEFNGILMPKLGDGSGMKGLPGDFTPPSRFVRAASFVSATPKELDRNSAILQGFRILSQMDIPAGSVINPLTGKDDKTQYTSIMDTKKKAYFIKSLENINLQRFYLEDFADCEEITFVELEKEMAL